MSLPDLHTLVSRIQIDDLSLVLLSALIALALASLYLRRADPLVHPLVLCRQSDLTRVRKAVQSAVYRNAHNGHGLPLEERPDREARSVLDLVKEGHAEKVRMWGEKISPADLKSTAKRFAAGLSSLPALPPSSGVHIALPSSPETLITSLACALLSQPSIASLHTTLYHALAVFPHAKVLVTTASAVTDVSVRAGLKERGTVVVLVGATDGEVVVLREAGVDVRRWEELLAAGQGKDALAAPEINPKDTFSYVVHPSASSHTPQIIELSHRNITAGVSSLLHTIPYSIRPQAGETFYSVHPLAEPFGLTIAFAALYSGSGIITAEPEPSAELDLPKPVPNYLFLNAPLASQLSSQLRSAASASLLYPLAHRHALASYAEGYVAPPSTSGVFADARKRLRYGNAIRQVFTYGGLPESTLATLRTHLSSPVTSHAPPHALLTVPPFHTHPHDFQSFPALPSHVGPPAHALEVRLEGDAVEDVRGPRGEVWVRGPVVGSVWQGKEQGMGEGAREVWRRLEGVRAGVRGNGTFVLE